MKGDLAHAKGASKEGFIAYLLLFGVWELWGIFFLFAIA
jgi:hypothetical protein